MHAKKSQVTTRIRKPNTKHISISLKLYTLVIMSLIKEWESETDYK